MAAIFFFKTDHLKKYFDVFSSKNHHSKNSTFYTQQTKLCGRDEKLITIPKRIYILSMHENKLSGF